jgi:hypothetical protein
MSNKKISMAVTVTLGVWIAALGSAAVLTYDLNRALHLRGTPPSNGVLSNPAQFASAERISETRVLYIPAVTVVGRYRPDTAPMPETFGDLSGKQCAYWRELEMSWGRVQVCE